MDSIPFDPPLEITIPMSSDTADMLSHMEATRKDPRDGAKVHTFLVRLENGLHERLRKASYDQRRPKSEIIRDALTLYLK